MYVMVYVSPIRNGTPPPVRSAASWNQSSCNSAGATRACPVPGFSAWRTN